MDKEKLFDYAVRLVEANLRSKGLVPFEFGRTIKELVPETYETLAASWKKISEESSG